MAGAIASRVSGLSVVTSKSSDAKKKKLLARVKWLPVTSHLYARMHGRTDKCEYSITSDMQGLVWGEPELVHE